MAEPTFSNQLLRYGTAGLALGAGARAVKHILDVTRNRDIRTPLSGRSIRPAISHVPVTVTPEEAAELRERGVDIDGMVDQPPEKLAGDNPFTGAFFQNAALGTVAVGGLAGGWKGADWLAERQRKSTARAKLDKQRARVEALLDGEGLPGDAKIAGLMAAGEDAMIDGTLKVADVASNALDMVLNNSLVAPLGYLAGPAAVVGLISSYRKARREAKDEHGAQQIARQFESATSPETPYLTLQPTLAR